jgi:hypothetical protein
MFEGRISQEALAWGLLRNRLRVLFRRRREMNRGEKDTEQRHQQINLHGVLRYTLTDCWAL